MWIELRVKCKMWTWVQSVMMLLHATQMSLGDPLKPVSSFMSTFSPHFHPSPLKQVGLKPAVWGEFQRWHTHTHSLSESVTRLATDAWQGSVEMLARSLCLWLRSVLSAESEHQPLIHSHWLAKRSCGRCLEYRHGPSLQPFLTYTLLG